MLVADAESIVIRSPSRVNHNRHKRAKKSDTLFNSGMPSRAFGLKGCITLSVGFVDFVGPLAWSNKTLLTTNLFAISTRVNRTLARSIKHKTNKAFAAFESHPHNICGAVLG